MKARALFSLLLVVAAWLPRTRATSIDPYLWEQFGEEADFIGVVECTTAGGDVAHYRVEEVLKGEPRVGATIAARITPDHMGPGYPMTLVGERFFVTLFRTLKPEWIHPPAPHFRAKPSAWRQVPADYYSLLFMGRARLDDHAHPAQRGFEAVGSKRSTLEEVKADFRSLIALTPEERALTVVRAVGRKYFHRATFDGKPLAELGAGVVDAASHDAAVRALIDAWDRAPGAARSSVTNVVEGAPKLTRRRLVELLPAPEDESYTVRAGDTLESIAKRFFGPEGSRYTVFEANRDQMETPDRLRVGMVLQLRRRQLLMNAATRRDLVMPQPADASRPPAPAELQEARRKLRDLNPAAREFPAVGGLLLRHDPEPVIRVLRAWTDPKRDPGDVDRGYILGSWAAAICGRDRARHLSALLDASDPLVRVAAAVHLVYDDEARALAALRRFARLPGDPGAWAALTLARRGDRNALPRAIEVLESRQQPNTILRPTLAARVLELLSNSAAAQGLETPVWFADASAATRAEAFVAAHPDLKPVDPWLPLLSQQKLD